MDNLASYKVAGIRAAIEAAGAELRYLPPYSPDFKPIEQFFAKLKALLRKAAARTVDALIAAIADILATVTPQECTDYLANQGYRHKSRKCPVSERARERQAADNSAARCTQPKPCSNAGPFGGEPRSSSGLPQLTRNPAISKPIPTFALRLTRTSRHNCFTTRKSRQPKRTTSKTAIQGYRIGF
jgi:hypothetical protein